MNYGPLIFLAAFFALAGSWFGFVLTPQMQVGQLQQTNTVPDGVIYPLARPGLAREGLDVYRANGCAACHSQQVRQSGIVCDVLLTDGGTNRTALTQVLQQINPDLTGAKVEEFLSRLPKPVKQGTTREDANKIVDELKKAGAKFDLWTIPVGPDIARGWGKRRSVAEDFLFDSPVMLGSQRIGPDLANVGMRLPDVNWHLRHLYSPPLEVEGSSMPPYRFMFEKRRIERAPSPDALALPPKMAPEAGYEIVPKAEAKALVAYLTSLQAGAPLFHAPLTVPAPPPAATNAPAGATSTNAPVK
jgi:cbb3-type cytochrome oxidase cytochrome c subunit